ncbi:MAG: hypothetical protein K9G70_07010 [Prolixibacteraceae bacterium]|nr:hypothetical protein [Prolixibacteraceae bacterium]
MGKGNRGKISWKGCRKKVKVKVKVEVKVEVEVEVEVEIGIIIVYGCFKERYRLFLFRGFPASAVTIKKKPRLNEEPGLG